MAIRCANVRDHEGVEHRMWAIDGQEDVTSWLADEPLLIADGHHRYATALAYRDERRAADGPGPWDRILSLVVDAGSQEVPVLPYHRVQIGGNRLPEDNPRRIWRTCSPTRTISSCGTER